MNAPAAVIRKFSLGVLMLRLPIVALLYAGRTLARPDIPVFQPKTLRGESRARRRLPPRSLALLLPALAAALMAFVVMSDGVRIFHPSWILHPDETGMLFTSNHLAETGSFTDGDAWYQQSPAHTPEGVTSAEGRLVPQKALLGYVIYAGAFLISDNAWQYVTPFFGLVSAAAIGWLVYRKTRNDVVAGLAAAIAFASSSPVIMYASGLAFVDIIATAFYLIGAVALYEHARSGSRRLLLGAGVAFAAAMLTRYDFFMAGAFATAIVLWGHRRRPVLTNMRDTLPLAAPLGLALAGTCVANWWLYGSPFTTGYDAGSWKSSPGGVATSIYDFSVVEFGPLAWAYLFQIGLACTVLLGLGIATKAWLRRWDTADALLLAFAGFGLVYFLGKAGAYGTGDAWLVASYPRYLLPVYAAGVIVGVEGIARILRPFRWSEAPVAAVLAAVALGAAAIGMHEAWSNERGVPYTQRLTSMHGAIARVVSETEKPRVLVSDLHSKAVIDAYTITPFKGSLRPEEVVGYVTEELDRGRNVIVVGDLRSHPLYTGYVEALRASDLELVPRLCSVEIYQAYRPGEAPPGSLRQCPDQPQ